jgi:hypothetical protein
MEEEIQKIIDDHYKNTPLIDTDIDSWETYDDYE